MKANEHWDDGYMFGISVAYLTCGILVCVFDVMMEGVTWGAWAGFLTVGLVGLAVWYLKIRVR